MFKLLVFLTCCLAATYSLSCSEQWECNSVTEHYNFVKCNNNVCECKNEQGFINQGTVFDKCRCNDGKVYYEDNEPYCVDVSLTSSHKYTYDILLSKTKLVFEKFTNRTIAAAIMSGELDVSDIVSPTSKLRVDILGSFGGVKEYLFALWAQNDILKSSLRNYAIDTVQKIVWVRTDYLFNFYGNMINVSYVGAIKFDEYDRMSIMDFTTIWFSNLDIFIQNPVAKDTIINATCRVYVENCIPLGYTGYSDFDDCRQYHLNLNFGTAALTEDNSTFCHYFHRSLTPYEDYHCTHMEPNGGDDNPLLAACSRKPPSFYYEQTEYDVN